MIAHLLTQSDGAGVLAGVGVILGVSALIGLALLVWYLWAMSRLFPRIGLPAGEGWIPIWNQWRLLDRVGLPGWIVLLSFVGLSIVPLIFIIIAMHRLNTQAGKGAGLTVLGIFIPPLWAMLLANAIGKDRVMGPAGFTGSNGFAGSTGSTGFAAAAPAAYAAPGAAAGTAAGATAPGGFAPPAPAPAAQQWSTSAAPQAPVAPPAPGFAPPAPAPAAPAPIPPAPAAQGGSQSPLGAATDAEYARLAAEPFSAPPAAPLGQPQESRPFSWTAASRAEEPPAPPAAVAPPMHPVAPVPPAPPAPPAPAADTQAAPALAAPPAPPAPPAMSMPEPPAPPAPSAPPAPPAPSAVPTALEESGESPWAPAPAASEPVGAPGKATGITGIFEPLPTDAPAPAVVGAAQSAAESAAESEDPIDDHTVVVPRKRAPQWLLVLPGGESYDLESDVIVGRRPESAEGSAVLAIADPTRTLSKSHVRMRFDGERWTVEDLGSTNGLVLLHEGGREEELEAHREVEATGRMMFGTLEVRLQRGGDAA